MGMTDYVIEPYDNPAYRAGYEAYMDGKHLVVPSKYESAREAWTLGWNDAWTERNERTPDDAKPV